MLRQPEKPSDQDFRTLGLQPGTSPEDVKRAYRDLVKRWHPDQFQQRLFPERKEAEERIKQITGAYRRIAGEWRREERERHRKVEGAAKQKREAPERKAARAPGDRGVHSGTASRSSLRFSKRNFAGTVKKWLSAHLFQWDRRSIGLFITLITIFFALVLVPPPHRFERPQPRLPDVSSYSLKEKETAPPREAPSGKPGDTPNTDPLDGKTPIEVAPLPSQAEAPLLGGGENSHRFYFTIGSPQAEVFRIQGVPDDIRGQAWVYGLSEVVFKDGRVTRYNNFDGSLKVSLIPSNPPPVSDPPSYFTLGSTIDEVILIQGTPTRIEGNRWYYGFSEVHFKDGRVQGFDNFFGSLRIRMLPSTTSKAASGRDYFTVGSSHDEVLAVQGTPTSIRGNLWFYQLSNVLFRHGKVQYVADVSYNLRFIHPEGQTRKE